MERSGVVALGFFVALVVAVDAVGLVLIAIVLVLFFALLAFFFAVGHVGFPVALSSSC